MTGLGPLTDLDLDHLDLWINRLLGKALGAEGAILVATAEIARTDLPDQVAAMLSMIPADAALARIMGKTAIPGALVHRQDGIGRQRAEAHGRDVQHTGIIGLRTRRLAGIRLVRAAADPD